MSLDWKVRPIVNWPRPLTKERRFSPFRTTKQRTYQIGTETHYGTRTERGADWTDTQDLLERELRMLGAKNVVLQMAVTERECRNDGWIRANARPSHPGVILSFESSHGPLSYPCDAFTEWQSNVRAIALSLEALRKVDRYGVTSRGEQYQGWGRLPPAGGSTATMTAQIAAEILVDAEELGGEAEVLLIDREALRITYRQAAQKTHPDKHGGDTKRFQLVNEAKRVLDRHHGAS